MWNERKEQQERIKNQNFEKIENFLLSETASLPSSLLPAPPRKYVKPRRKKGETRCDSRNDLPRERASSSPRSFLPPLFFGGIHPPCLRTFFFCTFRRKVLMENVCWRLNRRRPSSYPLAAGDIGGGSAFLLILVDRGYPRRGRAPHPHKHITSRPGRDLTKFFHMYVKNPTKFWTIPSNSFLEDGKNNAWGRIRYLAICSPFQFILLLFFFWNVNTPSGSPKNLLLPLVKERLKISLSEGHTFSFPTRIWPLGTSAFQEFFSNFTEVSKCQKNGAITRAPFSSAFAEVKKKDLFWFLAIFDKNTGHRVTKFYPDTRISNTYKSYFINFFLTRKKLLFFSLIYAIESSLT